MGFGKGRRRHTYVGGRHGLPNSPLHHRSPAEACGSRHLRLHPCSRLLLRGHHQLVLASPPVEHTERLDSLHNGRSASHIMLPQSHLYAWRKGHRTDSRIQLFFLMYQELRMRGSRERAMPYRKQHLRNRLRRLRETMYRRKDHSILTLQSSQPCRTRVEKRRIRKAQ